LPTQLDGNVQAMRNIQAQLHAVSDSMNRARERRLLIERQMADVQGPAVDLQGAVHSESTSPGTAVEQLDAARGRLAELQQRYTPKHPEVQAAEQSVRELQAQANEETQRGADSQKPLSPFEMARAKRLNDLQAEQAIIDDQLVAAQAEEVRLKGELADYQAKVAAVPTRESELVELTRDYSTIQQAYASLLQKREDSNVAANMERRQIAEQFRVLDPASLPERAYNQRARLAVLFGGPGGGLVLGFLLIAALEQRDSSFKREEEVVRVLSLPVLALIPAMDDDPHIQTRRGVGARTRITAALAWAGSASAALLRNSQL
jgi:uncharacterized protein involved in exopolysaccharide biosynthesis